MNERIITDTSNIFSIDYGDLIVADGRHYRVTGHERERRFGATSDQLENNVNY